jgi:iron complex outermembrane recepter protein
MVKQNQLVNCIRNALMFSLSGAIAMPAMAQDEAKKEEAKKTDTLEDVVVTGSRIRRADAETAQPVLVVTRADIEKTGLTSVGDIVQRLAEAGPSINTQFNNGGNGSTTIDLRNLGANRTLVLLNGHRWVTQLNGAVDLNTIPTAIIESIEILKDGASTVYGSDAIAGVVNIITRRGYEGATASGFYGQNSQGDGTRWASDFTFGVASDRGSASISAGYVKEDSILAGDRAISSVPNFGLDPRATGSSTTPSGRYFVTGLAGSQTNNAAQSGDRNVLGQYRPFSAATDLFNFQPDNYLVTPQERASIFAEGRYSLTDAIEFNAHMLYNNRKSSQLLASIPVLLGTRGSGTVAPGITVAANNPYNPFGATVVGLQRRFVETGGRRFEQDNNTFRFGGGFSGSFDAADRTFNWDTGYSYSTNKETQLTKGQLNLARVRTSLSAIDNPATAAFDPVCVPAGATTAAVTIAGCVPLNILAGVGGITPAMLNYVTFTGIDKAETESTNLYGNISGSIFELPAGPLGFAVGYEYRKENGRDLPDAITAAGETTGNARLATSGGFDLKEVYGEFAIPLLADAPFAELLEARLAGRYSDYSNFGNTTNFSAGFQWKPISDLKVRGNYNQGFRAPTINELFQGVSDNFPQISDPCLSGTFGGRARSSADTIANCNNGIGGVAAVPVVAAPTAANPNGTGPTQSNSQIRTQSGGFAGLTPEDSKGYTFGFVYSPEYLAGFDVTVDYWNIKIKNVIGGRGAGTLLNNCYVNGKLDACRRITRSASTNEISNILAVGENVGFNDISGLDLGLGYKLPEFDFGKFSARLDSTYFIKDTSQNLGYNDRLLISSNGQPPSNIQYFDNNPVNNNVGVYGGRGGTTNRLKSNLSVDWVLGAWSANWTARYTSGFREGCGASYLALAPTLCDVPNGLTQANTANPQNFVGGVTYHDFSVAYAGEWDGTIRVGAKNVFEKEPPFQTTTFANSFDPAYEVPGAFWYLSYNQKF